MSEPIAVLDEARKLRKWLNYNWLVVSSRQYVKIGPYYDADYKNDFVDGILALTKAETEGKDENDLKTIALRIMTAYTTLASSNCISQGKAFMGAYEENEKELKNMKSANEQLKKENEQLIEKYFILDGRYKEVSEKYDNMVKGLAKKAGYDLE